MSPHVPAVPTTLFTMPRTTPVSSTAIETLVKFNGTAEIEVNLKKKIVAVSI